MDNYICVNGRKVELTAEQLKALGIEKPKEANPFERQEQNELFYWITGTGRVVPNSRDSLEASTIQLFYDNGNYCADENLMQQRAWHETLSRLLWRFSMSHSGDTIKPQNVNQSKYVIRYDRFYKEHVVLKITKASCFEETCFRTKEIAQQAIEEVLKPFIESHPEFRW